MLVIGNGESRKQINIDNIQDIKIGCNAIHRDYIVDHLVCVDRRMVNQALDAGVNDYAYIYTREDWFDSYKKYKKVRTVPDLPYVGSERADEPFNWGSGPYAVLLAAKLSEQCHLIGFDLYGKDKKVNNIYKDTEGYDTATKSAVDPRFWVYQLSKIFEIYNRRSFTIYQTDDWEIPKQWKFSNVKVDNISNIYYNS